jgi:hypothetical protein
LSTACILSPAGVAVDIASMMTTAEAGADGQRRHRLLRLKAYGGSLSYALRCI